MNPVTVKAMAELVQSRTARRGAGLTIALNAVLVLLLMAIPVLLTVVILASLDASVQAAQPPAGCDVALASNTTAVGDLDDEQMTNAAAIVNVARENGVSEYGQVVAIATALQESTLRNYSGGHADSIGVFQQRPSQGWGTAGQIGNAERAAEAFFGVAGHTRNTGLLDVRGWEKLPITVAAQQVQRSAFPNAYADDEPLARQVVASFSGGGDTSAALCGAAGAMTCPSTGFSVEQGMTPDGLRVIRCMEQQFTQAVAAYGGLGHRASNPESDHDDGRAVDAMIADWDSNAGNEEGWRIARWTKQHAPELGVTYVIFDGKIWSQARADEGWRPYEHPSGATDPTSMHLDHVHVSVAGNSAGYGAPGKVRLPVDYGGYALTARFGECSDLWASCHTGLDFAAPYGTPVKSAVNGRVTSVEYHSAYGNLTGVTDAGGTEYWYAHQEDQYVAIGDRVRAGQLIGTVGSTGNSTGPHLHFEVREMGMPVDPEIWLADHGVDP